ncbi:MAG: tetraacyldisaccharide 4'-kinase [Desulfarculaceae bacterium]|nr:tetraacyldisaccharide 4'-kinase [Desulfarculaceae bacterium]
MAKRYEALWRRMAGDEPGPAWLGALRGAASAASGLYAAGAWLDQAPYDLGLRKQKRLPVPVVGVGNLAVGGTGKTPLVMAVVQALGELGLPAGVISRGYGRKESKPLLVSDGSEIMADAAAAGDEPVLLARRLGVPVAVGARRHEAGRLLLERCGPRVLVGDDLFQHRELHRDLNLLALDAADPLAGGRLLPRGRLRETAGAMARADAVVLTRARDAEQGRVAAERRAWRLEGKPVLSCAHQITGMDDALGQGAGPEDWQGAAVLAFCGLAAPESFRAALSEAGLTVLELKSFGDHHRFTPAEVSRLWDRAQTLSARALVCSGKDAVRLPGDLPPDAAIWSSRLDLRFHQGPGSLAGLLARALDAWEPRL